MGPFAATPQDRMRLDLDIGVIHDPGDRGILFKLGLEAGIERVQGNPVPAARAVLSCVRPERCRNLPRRNAQKRSRPRSSHTGRGLPIQHDNAGRHHFKQVVESIGCQLTLQAAAPVRQHLTEGGLQQQHAALDVIAERTLAAPGPVRPPQRQNAALLSPGKGRRDEQSLLNRQVDRQKDDTWQCKRPDILRPVRPVELCEFGAGERSRAARGQDPQPEAAPTGGARVKRECEAYA
jgi:hypothetical protein